MAAWSQTAKVPKPGSSGAKQQGPAPAIPTHRTAPSSQPLSLAAVLLQEVAKVAGLDCCYCWHWSIQRARQTKAVLHPHRSRGHPRDAAMAPAALAVVALALRHPQQLQLLRRRLPSELMRQLRQVLGLLYDHRDNMASGRLMLTAASIQGSAQHAMSASQL
eukprot:TRINITY_DN8173_c0_g1_i2.p2 TRINITY_DN8173_c0_g1~~TRINITY_DN8173_c0_g1_i2.p2  ORF type:complete len:162 (+),score=29.90 TRINITY_DN8173_c0_g1_i2:664-1149(+)